MQDRQYELSFLIGYDNKLGLLEDYDKKGEIKIPLHSKTIQECSDISVVLNRLAMFMTSHSEVSFKRITFSNFAPLEIRNKKAVQTQCMV